MFCYSVLICETQYISQVRSAIPTKCFRGFCPFSPLELTAYVKVAAVARQYSAHITGTNNLQRLCNRFNRRKNFYAPV